MRSIFPLSYCVIALYIGLLYTAATASEEAQGLSKKHECKLVIDDVVVSGPYKH